MNKDNNLIKNPKFSEFFFNISKCQCLIPFYASLFVSITDFLYSTNKIQNSIIVRPTSYKPQDFNAKYAFNRLTK